MHTSLALEATGPPTVAGCRNVGLSSDTTPLVFIRSASHAFIHPARPHRPLCILLHAYAGRRRRAVHDGDGRVRTVGRIRRRTRSIDGLCELSSQRQEHRDHPSADHGPRRWPRRSLPALSITRSSSRRTTAPGTTRFKPMKFFGRNEVRIGDRAAQRRPLPTSHRSASSTTSSKSSPTRRPFQILREL